MDETNEAPNLEPCLRFTFWVYYCRANHETGAWLTNCLRTNQQEEI